VQLQHHVGSGSSPPAGGIHVFDLLIEIKMPPHTLVGASAGFFFFVEEQHHAVAALVAAEGHLPPARIRRHQLQSTRMELEEAQDN
jgi:hypothetical protein